MNLQKNDINYDVIVVGGGSGGIGAAVGAARVGAKVLLIERNPFLGGNATQSSLNSYCGFFTKGIPALKVVGGVGDMVLHKLFELNSCRGPLRLSSWGIVVMVTDPEAVKYVLDELTEESGIDILLHSNVIKAEKNNSRIHNLICQDDEGYFNAAGKVFVDATGEANLTFLSGGRFVYGNTDGNAQNGTLSLRFGGIEDNNSIDQEVVEKAIASGIRDGIGPLSRKTCVPMPIPNTMDIIVNLSDENVNGLDAVSLTRSEISGRKQSRAYLQIFRRYIPNCKNAYLVQTGPKIGIRETRHIVGESTICGNDIIHGKKREDSIARGAWPVEIHAEPGKAPTWCEIKGNGFYDIPLSALKSCNIENLWTAGRIISCDDIAFSSIRVMGTCFATGHAAGVAAALQSQYIQKISAQLVRAELIRQKAII